MVFTMSTATNTLAFAKIFYISQHANISNIGHLECFTIAHPFTL